MLIVLLVRVETTTTQTNTHIAKPNDSIVLREGMAHAVVSGVGSRAGRMLRPGFVSPLMLVNV